MNPLTHDPLKQLQPARPLALVAEDNLKIRENTVRRLESRGVAALAVGSFAQAANALKVSPPVDVALLDIHLDADKDRDDRGGLQIARHLRSTSPTTRIIGYSGQQQLSSEERALFDDTTMKGSLTYEDHMALWELCADLARKSYEARRGDAFDEQDRLRRLYEVEIPAIEVLRRLQMDDPPAQEYTAEGALGLAGYRIKVVSLASPDRAAGASRPFVVWEQRVDEGERTWINLEVYGHPRVYATGPTEADALAGLGAFIALTHADLQEHSPTADADVRLKAFLDSLAE